MLKKTKRENINNFQKSGMQWTHKCFYYLNTLVKNKEMMMLRDGACHI